MKNYDDWKLDTPDDELENECAFCGEPCKKEFCSKDCRIAYLKEN